MKSRKLARASRETQQVRAESETISLKQFVQHNTHSYVCWACSLPAELVSEIDEALDCGTTQTIIEHWLRSVKHVDGASRYRVRKHAMHRKGKMI